MRPAAALVLAGALLAACGGGGDDDDDTSAGTTSTSAAVVQTTRPAATTTTVPATYIVQAGDSLSAIAAKFGVKTADLATANGITDPNKIFVGQELIIPTPSPTDSVATTTTVPIGQTVPTTLPGGITVPTTTTLPIGATVPTTTVAP